MQAERRTDRNTLQQEYGISRRLSARLVALLSRQVGVTPTLIEVAQPGSAVEELLLHPDWLREPESLTPEQLGEAAAQYDVPPGLSIVVEDTAEGWRILGLEDDLLADQAAASDLSESADLAATETGLMKAAEGTLVSETEQLFSAEEVARIKLAALTSQNPEERIEAMRKLVFAPMTVADKAGVYVSVMIDRLSKPHVRAEASGCLQRLGFREDLADPMRQLYSEDETAVNRAIERISALLREAESGEQAVTLTVLLEVYDQTVLPARLLKLLSLFEQNAELVAQHEYRRRRLIETTLKHLSISFRPIHAAVEDLLIALSAAAPEAVADLLWREIQRTESPQVRGFLLAMTDQLSVDDERVGTLAQQIVDEILSPELNERQRARLRYALGRMANSAVTAILRRLPDARAVQKPELVRLLDVMCTEGELSDENFNRAISMLLDQLKVGDRQTRRTVLETRVCADPRVPPEMKRQLASEFLAHLHEFRLPDTHEAIRLVMLALGPLAVEALFGFIVRGFPSEDADEALKTLGQIVVEDSSGIPAERLEKIADFCMEAFDRDDVSRGGFVICLADICGFSDYGLQRFDEALKRMFQLLWKSPYTFAILEAQGIMAGSPNATESHQKQLTALFSRILNMAPPEELGQRRQTDEGPVYEFGREVDFDTMVIPTAVRGLERIVSSEQAGFEVRETIVKQLLILWEGVSNMRVVWSPAAVEALIRAMSTAAQNPLVPVRVRIRLGRSLLQFVSRLSVIKSLGDICAQPDPSGQLEPFCMEAAEALISEWESCDQQDEDRKSFLMTSLARIASNPSLSSDDETVRRVRDEVVQILFQGVREVVPGVAEALGLMRDCPDVPEEQRREIRERMQKAFGLSRAADQRTFRF